MLKCRLCRADQTKIKCELVNNTILEILEMLCIPTKILTGLDVAICVVCREKLHSLFLFKSKCISVEDFLCPYYLTEKVEISLSNILLKNQENHVGEDLEICRLCLNNNRSSSLLFNLITKQEYQSVFDIYLPELDLKSSKYCHICTTCIQNLDKFAELTKCISTTQELIISEYTIPEGNIPSVDNESKLLIKKEETITEDELKNNIININMNSDSQFTNRWKDFTSIDSSRSCFNHLVEPKQELNIEDNINVNMEPDNKSTNLPSHNRLILAFYDNHPAVLKQIQQKPLLISSKEIKLPEKPRKNPQKIIKCNVCSKQFRKTYNLNVHYRSHDLSCSQCDYKGRTRKDVKLHFRGTHPGTIKCSLCHKSYHSQVSLNMHFLKYHTDTSKLEKLECFLCEYKSLCKKSLRRHIQRHQEKQNPTEHKCDSCNYSTTRIKSFHLHKQVKHGSDIFNCQLCEFTAKVKDSVRKHYNNMHKDISEVRLFTCSVCSFQTKYPSSFKSHQLLHKDPSTVTKYHCAHCSFKTIYRHKFSHHLKQKHIMSKTKEFDSISTNDTTKNSSNKSDF